MKTLSKVLCLLMVAVMCMSLFGASASAFSLSIGSGSYGNDSGSGFSFSIGDEIEPVVETTPAPTETPKATETPAPTETPKSDVSLNAIEEAVANGKTSVVVEDITLDKEIEISGSLKISVLGKMKNADKLIVKGELTLLGQGSLDKMPTVKDGAKLVVMGCEFAADPSKYVPAGYTVKDTGASYVVSKTEEVIDDGHNKNPDASLINKLTLTDKEYTKSKKDDTPIAATFDASFTGTTNFDIFAIVSTKASTVTDKDVVAAANYDLAYSGNVGTITFKSTYLDGLEAGNYWLVGIVMKDGKVESHGYSDSTFEIKPAEVVTPGPGAVSGLTVSVYDSKYNVYNCWKSGYGALNFYYTPAYEVTSIIIDDMNSTLKITLNNEQWRDLGSGYFYLGETQVLNKLSSGKHTLTLNAVDAAGNPVSGTCDFYIKQVPTLSVLNSSKHVINSAQNLKFVCTTPIAEVWVGNKRLDNVEYEMYRLSDGGQTLTLTAQFLNNRTAGNSYYLKIVDTAGEESNVVTFQILTTAQANASVSTGDTANVALWTAFLLLSGAAVAVTMPKLKKSGND